MALASAGARADGSLGFLVAYRTLANLAQQMTSNAPIRLLYSSTGRVCIE